jgi:hypothetical protein
MKTLHEDELYSGLLQRVVWEKFTDVSEVLFAAFIFKVLVTARQSGVQLIVLISVN